MWQKLMRSCCFSFPSPPSSPSPESSNKTSLFSNSMDSAAGEAPKSPMERRVIKKEVTQVNVDEEYTHALRTTSFINIWNKAHRQLVSSSPDSAAMAEEEEEEEEEGHTHPSHLSLRYYTHFPDILLEPKQETLVAATINDDRRNGHHRFHSLLLDYFNVTLDSCTACASLLSSIDCTRTHHRRLRLLLRRLSATTPNPSALSDLASHLTLDNPLSPENLSRFHIAHGQYPPLVRRLTAAHRRILSRARVVHFAKRASGYVIIIACGAVAMVAVHAAGVFPMAAPAAVPARWGRCGGYLRRAGPQVDAAAKGAYIVGRDLDTVSTMVRRLHDEVEHDRDIVRMVLRSREPQMVVEVAREVEAGEAGFREQLEELEEHVYLCLLTINRSRRMVAEGMGGEAAQSGHN